jgi:hypothetical protein
MRHNRTKSLAGILLLIFFAQCLWLIHAEVRSESGCYPAGTMARQSRVAEGLAQWRGQGVAGTPQNATHGENFRGYDHHRSPLWYLVAAAPVVLGPAPSTPAREKIWLWLTRIPFLVFGVLLGASLWYVTRRLYGNAGGLIALVLYCFSPGIIQNTSEVCRDSEIGAAWGAFGAIFTAIALAHTLYAPREVVLWNAKRIALLAISLALAVGSQFSLAILLPVTLILLLYLAPERRAAAVTIWLAACASAALLLAAAYSFQPTALWQSLRAAKFWDISGAAFAMSASYRGAVSRVIHASPLLVLLLPAALVSYLLWRRTRYFGNTAPLLMVALTLGLGIAAPGFPGEGFFLVAMPFLFVTVAGIFADLLETRFAPPLRILLSALLSGYAAWSLFALAQV